MCKHMRALAVSSPLMGIKARGSNDLEQAFDLAFVV